MADKEYTGAQKWIKNAEKLMPLENLSVVSLPQRYATSRFHSIHLFWHLWF